MSEVSSHFQGIKRKKIERKTNQGKAIAFKEKAAATI